MTETLTPCWRRCGMTREIRVVFPAPLHPAIPITLIVASASRPIDRKPYIGCLRLSHQGARHDERRLPPGLKRRAGLDEGPSAPAAPASRFALTGPAEWRMN